MKLIISGVFLALLFLSWGKDKSTDGGGIKSSEITGSPEVIAFVKRIRT